MFLFYQNGRIKIVKMTDPKLNKLLYQENIKEKLRLPSSTSSIIMLRFNQQQDSSRTVSTKTFITNSSNQFYPQQNEKSTFSFHQSEVSAQKPLKKGIKTLISHSLQSSQEQSAEKIIFVNRKSEYEYSKSLEIQIASRERERLEIYKNLQDLKRQHGKLTYELNEERKKSAAFRMKTQQLEIFLKQNSDKKIAISNQKDQLFNQYQFQIQRRKSVEQNEQKLRFKLENLQIEFNNKTNQYNLEINKANQENTKLKQQIQKFNYQLKVLQFSNQSFQKQLSDLFMEKQKTISFILMEKHQIENQLQKQKSEHQELKNIYMQKEEELKSLDKNFVDLSQEKQSQKTILSHEISQIKLQSQSVKMNYEVAKENFKRQLQVLVNERGRMREIITQLQNEKNIDKSYITVMQRQIQVLQKQKSQETHQKITLSQQLQKQRISFQQQKYNLNQKIIIIESGLNQKQRQLQELNKKQRDLQRETQIAKYRYSTQRDLLLREIHFLKQQISAKSSQFSETSSKLNQERQKLQKQLYQKNSFADNLSKDIEQLKKEIKRSEDEISTLKSELVINQQRYEKDLIELKSQLEEEFKREKNKFQLQKQEIRKQEQKVRDNFYAQTNKLKLQIDILKQEKNQLSIIFYNVEKSSSISIQQLKSQIQTLESQKNDMRNQIQRLTVKHAEQFQLLTHKKANEIASIQEEHQAQVNLLNSQFSQKNQLLQNQIFSSQEKLKQFQKIIQKKNLQYQELQKHFNQIIERQNQQHNNQIHKYLQQIQLMGERLINASNQDFLIKKIQLLQECLQKKQAEVKVLEENNTLLRKNFINSLTEQQNLREEIKTNRSQYSENKSQSVQKSRRDLTQQLRSKYLAQIGNQHPTQNELEDNNNEMNLSLKQRSNSNSQLKIVRFGGHQRSCKYVPLLSLRSMENNEAQFESQKPVSNIQKPPPFDPLNLKRIRERNQMRYNTQFYNNMKSSQETKPQNCNSNSQLTTSQVIPISLQQSLDRFTSKQDEQLSESQEQF